MKFSTEEKALWLEDWKQSGKKAWAYARENGLIPQTFCCWAKRATEKASGFVEIPAHKKPEFRQQPQEIIIEKADVRIHIPLGLSSVELRSVMEGLRAVL